MVKKKSVKRKTSHKRKTVTKKAPASVEHTSHKSPSDVRIEKALVENFVSLQKVMVNLSVKFDNLTNKISKLLELFEISAKALAEKDMDIEQGKKDNKEFLQKLDTILDQNKTIARGMTLMHEKINDSSEMEEQPQIPMRMPQPMPQHQMNQQPQKMFPKPSPMPKNPNQENPDSVMRNQSKDQYNKSMFSKDNIR